MTTHKATSHRALDSILDWALLAAFLAWYRSSSSEQPPQTYDLTQYRPKPRKF